MAYKIYLKENDVIVFEKVFATEAERTAYISGLQSRFSYENLDEVSPATDLSDLNDDANHRVVTDAEKATWNAKQAALGYTPENSANKQTDLTASATKYPTVNAVNTGLGLKANLAGATFTGLVRLNSELNVTTTDVDWTGAPANSVKMDGVGEECSVSMGDGSGYEGAVVTIYCYDISNPCTANFNGATFGGSYSFSSVGETITVLATGSGWQVISVYIPS